MALALVALLLGGCEPLELPDLPDIPDMPWEKKDDPAPAVTNAPPAPVETPEVENWPAPGGDEVYDSPEETPGHDGRPPL